MPDSEIIPYLIEIKGCVSKLDGRVEEMAKTQDRTLIFLEKHDERIGGLETRVSKLEGKHETPPCEIKNQDYKGTNPYSFFMENLYKPLPKRAKVVIGIISSLTLLTILSIILLSNYGVI